MATGNKWEILETSSEISGEYKWFPHSKTDAYAFLFLNMMINGGLLAILFKVAQNGLPPIGAAIALFLIFVLPALFLNYWGLTYFKNKSVLSLTKNKLTLKNTPLPWYSNKHDIDTADIKQFYIEEKKVDNAMGTKNSYFEVKMKLNRQGSKTLFPYTMKLHEEEAREWEQRFEAFLGLEDEFVHGEYTTPTPKDVPKSAQKAKRATLPDVPLYNANNKDVFEHDRLQLHVAHSTQYDWKSGNSDKQIQALDNLDDERLFYLKRNKGLIEYYIEHSILLGEIDSIAVDFSSPAKTLSFKKQEYVLAELQEGNAFHDGKKGAHEIRQIWYVSKDKKEAIRVLLNDAVPTYYHATKTSKHAFQNQAAGSFERLDLKEIRKEKRMNLLDDDFV